MESIKRLRDLPVDFLLPEKLLTDLDTPAVVPIPFGAKVREQAVAAALANLQRTAEEALKKLT